MMRGSRNFVESWLPSRLLNGLKKMNYPGSYFHSLKGGKTSRFTVRLTANYRITFRWDKDGAVDVDIEDYH